MRYYDLSLERAVLQTVLYHYPSLVKLSAKHLLVPDHFSDLSYRKIYRTIKSVFDSGARKPNKKLVKRYLEKIKKSNIREKALAAFERIRKPKEETIHNVDAYVDELDALFTGRKLQFLIKDTAKSLQEGDVAEALASVQKMTSTPDTGIPIEDSDFMDIFDNSIELDKQKKKYPELFRRFPTGIKGVDVYSGKDMDADKSILNGGLMRSTFTLIGGDTGLGKSMTLNAMFLNWVRRQVGGLFVTNEMSLQDAINRAIAGLTLIPFNRLERGELDEEDYAKIRSKKKYFKKMDAKAKIVSYPEVSTAGSLKAKMLEYKQEGFNPQAVAVDYLNEMSEDSVARDSRGDWAGIGRVASDLRGLSLSWDTGIELDNGFHIYGIPVVTATQKKTSAAGKSSARTEDAAYSPVPGQIASAVAHLVQDAEMKEMEILDMIFTKCRFGKLGRIRMFPDFAKSKLHSKKRHRKLMEDNSFDLGEDDAE